MKLSILLMATMGAWATGILLTHSSSQRVETSFVLPDDKSCYYEKDPTFAGVIETGGGKGGSYRGLVSTTVSGRTCQKWTATHPWKEAAKLKPKPDKETKDGMKWGNGLGNHNFCRNPDKSEDRPWCYTMDPTNKHKKELCEIPTCPTKMRDFQREHKTTAVKIKSKDCECMDELYGSSRTSKDTSVKTYTGLMQGQWGRDEEGKPCSCKN